jgi:hypothetical protein
MLASPFDRRTSFYNFLLTLLGISRRIDSPFKRRNQLGRCSAASAARCELFIASGTSQCQSSARSSASLGKKQNDRMSVNTLRLLELYPGMKCWWGLQSHTVHARTAKRYIPAKVRTFQRFVTDVILSHVASFSSRRYD